MSLENLKRFPSHCCFDLLSDTALRRRTSAEVLFHLLFSLVKGTEPEMGASQFVEKGASQFMEMQQGEWSDNSLTEKIALLSRTCSLCHYPVILIQNLLFSLVILFLCVCISCLKNRIFLSLKLGIYFMYNLLFCW